jgi:hypothetical protein
MTDNTNGDCDYAAWVEQNREAARAGTADTAWREQMSDFGELVKTINGIDHEPRLTREQQLEILAAINKPAPNVRWTQKDLDETVQHIYQQMHTIIIKNVLPAVGKFVEMQVKPLRERIDELEHKTENFKYVGVYESGNVYRLGNFCTHNGSLWHCECDTTAAPGTDNTWQMCVKRGKDAR